MTKSTFIKKHGIYLIICILLIVIICFCIYNTNKLNSEGFYFFGTIKDTDYLEPVKEIISDDLWTILNTKMNKEYPDLNFTEEKIKEYTGFITKEEINYYLSNNKFPWSNYVTIRFKELLISDSNKDPESKTNIDPEAMVNNLMKNFPNRYAYKQYITSSSMKDSLTSDTYLIYSGEKPAPTEKK